ncbi:uncharacterized protein IL334_006247 [Kwoniella shivajii]|uniref:Protein CPL1-like domain-containing protein n=1 Tax=Kwoniella shivajii TaxID=564305 RepID=A0ABZ1D5E5_9TREE|nr:hypothetical protein IL334_006247 [Kwoniella shivajii]
MSPKFSVASAMTIMAVTALGVNAYTYVGCVDTAPRGSNTIASIAQGNAGKCNDYCTSQAQASPFFYYLSAEEQCFCSTVSPEANSFMTGASNDGGCASASNYEAYDTATTFVFQGCYNNMRTDAAPSNVDDLEDCFAACASEGSVMYNPFSEDDIFGCRCNDAQTIIIDEGSNAVTCDTYTWFTFTHSQEATASGLARRRLRERLMELKRESQTLCPNGARPCSVPDSNTYECIDTRSELESCGGCISGDFQAVGNSTVGQDCSSLPGVARGAVTCFNSACEAFACKPKYELISGQCVPI